MDDRPHIVVVEDEAMQRDLLVGAPTTPHCSPKMLNRADPGRRGTLECGSA